MIEKVILNDKIIIKKEVNNVSVYYYLKTLAFYSVPKIIKIEGNTIFYEYIEGDNLLELLQKEELSINERIAIGLQLIEGIKLINDNFIIHKDLKPENIIIDNNGQVFFIDFDASRLFDGGKNRDTVLLGTQPYASPEHYGYAETTFLSDMYSLGKILIDLKLPTSFDDLISKCIEINPINRYESYDALLRDYNSLIKYKKIIKISPKKKTKNIKTKFKNMIKNHNYNYDKSFAQRIIAIIIVLVSISNMIENHLKPPSTNSNLATYFISNIWATMITIYLFDFIRQALTSRHRKNDFAKYKKRAFKNNGIIFLIFCLLLIVVNPSQIINVGKTSEKINKATSILQPILNEYSLTKHNINQDDYNSNEFKLDIDNCPFYFKLNNDFSELSRINMIRPENDINDCAGKAGNITAILYPSEAQEFYKKYNLDFFKVDDGGNAKTTVGKNNKLTIEIKNGYELVITIKSETVRSDN